MKKKTFKLAVFDLDGTLLNSGMKISSYSKKKLFELAEKGLKLAIISSRALFNINNLAGTIPFNFIAALNGALIFNPNTLGLATGKPISKINIQKVIYDEKLSGHSKNIYSKEKVYITKFASNLFVRLYQFTLGSTIINSGHFNKDFFQIDIIVDKKDDYDKVFRYVNKKYSSSFSIKNAGYNFIVLNDKKVDKGYALLQICRRLNIKLSDTIVVGDSLADLKMFYPQCYKIAMKNSHKTLLAKADKITLHKNSKDGAVKEIITLIDGGENT
jgi:Cof subfamily protein (haloacid dehalogenase superfamily)